MDRWFDDSPIGYARLPVRESAMDRLTLPLVDSETGQILPSFINFGFSMTESSRFEAVVMQEIYENQVTGVAWM